VLRRRAIALLESGKSVREVAEELGAVHIDDSEDSFVDNGATDYSRSVNEKTLSSKDKTLGSIRLHDASTRGAQVGIKGFFFRPYVSFFVSSIIRRYPQFVRPLLVLARNLNLYLLPTKIEWKYSSDELATKARCHSLMTQSFSAPTKE